MQCARIHTMIGLNDRQLFEKLIIVLTIHFERKHSREILFVFVCSVALRPKSTAMVIAGRSVHLTTLFPGQA